MIINNEKLIQEVERALDGIKPQMDNEMLMEMFSKDFSFRFCWSSNAIEGNTLSLDETVALIEYDEVKAGKPYSHYKEAKSLYRAISESMLPFHQEPISESWIKKNNAIIMESSGEYRKGPVYVGSLVEAVYYPPAAEEVPTLMNRFLQTINFELEKLTEIMEKVAKTHFDFERIHPFPDGNGRVGRMILNQQLINNGLLPVAIGPKGDYRRSFLIYDRSADMSKLIHELCKAEINSVRRIQCLQQKMNQDFVLNPSLSQKVADAEARKTTDFSCSGAKENER